MTRSAVAQRLVAASVPMLVTLVAACGGAGGGPTITSTASGLASPTSSPSSGEVATLSNAATRVATYVRVGATVEVALTANPGYRFTTPVSTAPAVLRPDWSATAGGVSSRFRALSPGTARLRATENPNCLPHCGLPSRLWEATVVVTPHPVP